MARILQVNTLLPGAHAGGAEGTIAEFAAELISGGHEVWSLGLRPWAEPRPEGLAAHQLSWRIPNVAWPVGLHVGTVRKMFYHTVDLWNPIAAMRLAILIRRLRPDLLLCHNLKGWSTAPWTVAAWANIPTLQVLHDFATVCARAQQFRPAGICHGVCWECAPRRLASRAAWRGGSVAAVSRNTLTRHLQTAVYIPSDTAVVYPPVVPTHAARTSVGGTSHRFGFIGRIENNKGIALLLEAASRLGEKVLVAGSGDDALRVTLEARFPGQADWCGWVEPGQFFRRIDVLVVPSLWPEPFGRVVAEAAAYGVPVIATAVGGIPEAAAISRAEVMLVPPTLSGLVDAMRNPRFARSSDQPAGSSLLTVVDQALRSPG